MVWKTALIASLLIAIPASAQDTTTTCYRTGNAVECHSRTRPNPYEAIQNYPDAGKAFMDAFNQSQLAQPAKPIEDTDYSRSIRKRVGEYLKAGDCDTAKALAARSGDAALENEVETRCADS